MPTRVFRNTLSLNLDQSIANPPAHRNREKRKRYRMLKLETGNWMLACIIHEHYIFIHKHFKAKGFEISTRPSADGLAQG